MYKKLTVGVTVPAYNEEKLITKTLSTIPDYVDHIVVVNDAMKTCAMLSQESEDLAYQQKIYDIT